MWKKLLTLLFLAILSTPIPLATASVPTGPNFDSINLRILPRFSENDQARIFANGEIDYIPLLTGSQAEQLQSTNIKIVNSTSTTVAYLFFNTRRNPCNDQAFREAFSRLINRDYICDTLERGGATPTLSYSTTTPSWINEEAIAPEFDSKAAAMMLEDAGYKLDTKTGWRINPNTGKTLEIVLMTPTQVGSRTLWDIGYATAYYANAIGIKCTQLSLPQSQLLAETTSSRDFDVLVQYVPFTRIPFGLYAMLHSSQDTNGTGNYSGLHDQILDTSLQIMWTGATEDECRQAALAAQERVSQLLPCVPVLAPYTQSAWSSGLSGVVNIPGLGVDNIWSYTNLSIDNQNYGGILQGSIIGNLTTLNPCTADSFREWGILQLVYSPMIYVNPSTGEDEPMLASSWSTEAWTTPTGSQGMKVKFNLRQGIFWQDGAQFTSRDYSFCIDYLRTHDLPNYKEIISKVAKVETPDDNTIIIYLNESGFRLIYALNWLTFMSERIWGDISEPLNFKPWEEANPTVKGLTKLVGTGPFIFVPGKQDVTLVWNPIYLLRTPSRPGLIAREETRQLVARGETLTVEYIVKSFAGTLLNDPSPGFTYYITSANQTVVDEGNIGLNGGYYEAKVDTSKLSVGSYTLHLKAQPYGSDSMSFTISQPSVTTGGVKLTVLDKVGKSIPGANISSTNVPNGQSALSGVSGSDGSLTFNNIAAGSYTFQASYNGYESSSSSATVIAGSVASTSITLQAKLTGGSPEGVPGYMYEEIVAGVILGVAVLIILKRK